jgi:hypothetical protein
MSGKEVFNVQEGQILRRPMIVCQIADFGVGLLRMTVPREMSFCCHSEGAIGAIVILRERSDRRISGCRLAGKSIQVSEFSVQEMVYRHSGEGRNPGRSVMKGIRYKVSEKTDSSSAMKFRTPSQAI